MNATSGAGGFNSFGVSLAQGQQPRNSVVGGGRHIPITKFSRGQTRGRALGGDSNTTGNKRGTSINFYQNTAGKIKNALDISMNKFDGGQNGKQNHGGPTSLNNSSIILNESIKQSGNPNNIFIGSSKPNTTAYMTHGMSNKKGNPNMYAGSAVAHNPSSVYQQHVLAGPSGNQFEVLGVSTQK